MQSEPAAADQRRYKVLVTNPGAELYGSDRAVLETVSALAAAGNKVTVALPEVGPLIERIEERGGRTAIVPTAIVRKSALRPTGFAKLVKDAITGMWPAVDLIRRERPDVLVINTIVAPLWLVAAEITHTPAITHVHEAETSGSSLVRRALTLPQLLADRLIVNSEFSRVVLGRSWHSLLGRSVVIYNAVPGPTGVSAPRKDLSAPIRLLYVGRLSPRKGPDVAVDALAVLVGRGVDVELDLVGAVFRGYEWFERGLQEKIAEYGLQDRVRFYGFRDNIWPFLERADINIVPSTSEEGFGNTAVEAALAGRPLIVSAMGGLLEAIDGLRASIAVTPSSPIAIADAVETIIERWPEYSGHALDDAASAADRYSTERYATSLLNVLADSAKSQRRRTH